MIEERNGTGETVLKRFYPQGEEWSGANAGDYITRSTTLGASRR